MAAVYFSLVSAVAAFNGQVVVGRWIVAMGRVSLVIFILASMIFISALSLGKPTPPATTMSVLRVTCCSKGFEQEPKF